MKLYEAAAVKSEKYEKTMSNRRNILLIIKISML